MKKNLLRILLSIWILQVFLRLLRPYKICNCIVEEGPIKVPLLQPFNLFIDESEHLIGHYEIILFPNMHEAFAI